MERIDLRENRDVESVHVTAGEVGQPLVDALSVLMSRRVERDDLPFRPVQQRVEKRRLILVELAVAAFCGCLFLLISFIQMNPFFRGKYSSFRVERSPEIFWDMKKTGVRRAVVKFQLPFYSVAKHGVDPRRR